MACAALYVVLACQDVQRVNCIFVFDSSLNLLIMKLIARRAIMSMSDMLCPVKVNCISCHATDGTSRAWIANLKMTRDRCKHWKSKTASLQKNFLTVVSAGDTAQDT